MMYTIIDNIGNPHYVPFNSDDDVLLYLRTSYIHFIMSILSSDPIVVYRPNGYILAYIKTSDGSQTVKSMSDWLGH